MHSSSINCLNCLLIALLLDGYRAHRERGDSTMRSGAVSAAASAPIALA
jgi:hypothetical protein